MTLKKKILIVEDNPQNLELFIDILGLRGYECVYTTKGEDAVDLAKKERPDIILLDIQLPEMDGMTVGGILKAGDDTKHLKIIAITAHALKGDKELFLKMGFDDYIPKPIKMKEFVETIERHLS
jgi:two-component system cell cycle response regulator DivK